MMGYLNVCDVFGWALRNVSELWTGFVNHFPSSLFKNVDNRRCNGEERAAVREMRGRQPGIDYIKKVVSKGFGTGNRKLLISKKNSKNQINFIEVLQSSFYLDFTPEIERWALMEDK